jgi:hypothetical protein
MWPCIISYLCQQWHVLAYALRKCSTGSRAGGRLSAIARAEMQLAGVHSLNELTASW